MRKMLLLSLLGLATFSFCEGCFAATRTPTVRTDEASALRILTDNGTGLCSGTAIAPRVILSATHCFDTTGVYLLVNGRVAKIERVFDDGNDHTLLVVDIGFENYAEIGPELEKGEDMHYWGNPGMNMFFRKGYVTGYDESGATYYDANGFQGDSGAGVFDEDGKLVGVVSFVWTNTVAFKMMGSFPMNFTKEQLEAAGVPEGKHRDAILRTGKALVIKMRDSVPGT